MNSLVYHQDWTTGLNFNDLVLSAGAGAITAGAGTEWVGLTTLGKALVGGGTGTGTAFASQITNQQPLNVCEAGISGVFGTVGSILPYGTGVQGTIRGLAAGGVLGSVQELATDAFPALGGVCK